jgi:hypothetical protein
MDRDILKGLADNPSLMAAVRKLLEDKFSIDSLKADTADQVLGQMVRARLVGLQAINEAFQELEKHRTPIDIPARENKAI